jgi:hypothetical protein
MQVAAMADYEPRMLLKAARAQPATERSTGCLQRRQSVEACPRDAPEAPSRANDRQRQHLANPNVDADLQPASNARDRLVMRRSLDGDEHQGAEVAGISHSFLTD